ncbi:LuxR family transcriptional regulator [Sphingobium sp. Sx8-8]|uniref:helix-turn-helix transcriptional regulator n=1 Tax=Sphingobium sp. Sx8-8 TaxID=2933617 RepID=UPI001F599524|nr:LuxR family transcriptional regulator [Sphingobium sp. Sx8-8]
MERGLTRRSLSSLRDAQAFIDALRGTGSIRDLGLLVDQISREMGFAYHALVHHVDPGIADGSMVRLENYPEAWVGTFIEKQLHSWDPVIVASRTTNAAFAWSDVPRLIEITDCQRDVLKAAAIEGLGDGFTVPAHMPGQVSGSCTFAVRTGLALPRHHLGMVQLVDSFAFQAARALTLAEKDVALSPRVMLTPRQLDCILLAGRGKSDWEIAQILGLKEDTVTEYLDAARARYGVARRIQLVMRAVHDGHIALSDLIE